MFWDAYFEAKGFELSIQSLDEMCSDIVSANFSDF